VATPVSGWVKVKGIPAVITKRVPGTTRILGWRLSPGFVPSERLPAEIPLAGHYSLEDTAYEGVSECYTRVEERSPETLENVPFQLHVIAERDTFEVVKSEFDLTYGLIDQLTIADPILSQEKPCRMSATQSYEIIRQHVKRNINSRYAEITSDYDFCFTVQKRIELAVLEPFTRDVGTKRRPKTVTDYRKHRSIVVYNVAPPDRQTGKPYNGYPLVEPFVGTSHEDLKARIAAFLEDLMEQINRPLCECKACGGKGVVVETVVPKASS